MAARKVAFTRGEAVVIRTQLSILLVAACAALSITAEASPARVSTVSVTAGKPTENGFVLSPQVGKRGTVVFSVVNKGSQKHGSAIKGQATRLAKPQAAAPRRVVCRRPGKYVCRCADPPPPADFGPGYNDVPTDCGGGVLTV